MSYCAFRVRVEFGSELSLKSFRVELSGRLYGVHTPHAGNEMHAEKHTVGVGIDHRCWDLAFRLIKFSVIKGESEGMCHPNGVLQLPPRCKKRHPGLQLGEVNPHRHCKPGGKVGEGMQLIANQDGGVQVAIGGS